MGPQLTDYPTPATLAPKSVGDFPERLQKKSILVERNLTKTEQLTKMLSAGETEATSAEEHLARDNQPKATNCRWGGQLYTCPPLLTAPKTIQSFLMPKKTSLPKARLSLNGKVDLSNSR